jgi:HSP20 family protein
MNLLPRLWATSQELPWDPLRVMRREMENALRAFDQNSFSPDIGAGAPAINVAETKDAFEVTAEPSRRGRERYQGQPGRQPAGHFW